MRYLQIQVKGYKALADVTFDLHPLTVMIGPNGCGKTSLLEIFQLFILIDEPEVSLHPELLQILAALLRDASARTQLLVATHSSDLIRWLRPDEVVVIDKRDGKSMFTWANDPSLIAMHWEGKSNWNCSHAIRRLSSA